LTHTVFIIEVIPLDPGRDLLISELSEINFDGFLESDIGFEGYIEKDLADIKAIESVFQRFREAEFSISYSLREEEEKNWNEEWEKNFDPVEVKDLCRIRAPFHSFKEGFGQEVIIMPKMSFGTGHHATTTLMVEYLMTTQMQGPLLDMGSGTGVLAILARKLGVENVTAIDINEWAFENAPDNCALNNIKDIKILQGDVALIKDKNYNTILANIDRNVLLRDIAEYAKSLNRNGQLFVSGFYTEDLKMIKEAAQNSGLIFIENKVKDNWVSAHFKKQ